jgi:hypothetical protein
MLDPGPRPRPGRLGRFISTSVAGETVRAFIPPPLPPNRVYGYSAHLAILNEGTTPFPA